jgi:hypothetical protein
MWEFKGAEDDIQLCSGSLMGEELDKARASHARVVSEATTAMEARERDLAAAERTATVERETFVSLELKLRGVLHSLLGGYEEPLAAPKSGLAGLLPKLVKALEDVAAGLASVLEEGCRALFTSAATRVFSHLHLRDPSFDLRALLEPVAPEARDATAEAMKKWVDDLLKKFLCIPDPAAAEAEADGGEDGGSVIDDGLPAMKAGDGSS